MQAGIVLREVAASSANFAELRQLSGFYRYPRADCHFVALCADQLEQHAMIFVSSLIQQQGWRLSGVHHHDVDVSVVIEIAESRAAPRCIWDSGKHVGNIFEGAVAIVAE